ncbi:uncharacterized protein LOC111360669 [Spodoptera litura]|uniref:Uncharacterized protein LOC111360669 n=1 Tax=Spodoptera litura TaxID=69820 RepID=A0A9J7EQB9_SPOLT|nr:uncharacterized protein LOC111360669 [Spodoptera litura]
MDKSSKNKYPSHLVLTAVLSGGISITVSLVYILLSIAALIYRFSDCGIDPTNPSQFFWKITVSAYILEDGQCELSEAVRHDLEITTAYTVFVLAALTLSFHALCLISAICLIIVIQNVDAARYLAYVVPIYIGTCVAVLVVDLTTAAHFGIDHSTLSSRLANILTPVTEPEPMYDLIENIYILENLRQGALYMMTFALKGYVAPFINIILIILLIVYVLEHRKLMKSNEHSIHKLGVLSGFDQPRKPDDNNWATQNEALSPYARGARTNNGFINDDESDRSSRQPNRRQLTRNDFNHSNRSYDRSDSWHHAQPNLAQSARPFSYLEDVRRPVPVQQMKPPPSPAVEVPWNRDSWQQGPPVPAPDYSPQPRRLKSALKPGYM